MPSVSTTDSTFAIEILKICSLSEACSLATNLSDFGAASSAQNSPGHYSASSRDMAIPFASGDKARGYALLKDAVDARAASSF